MRTGVALGIAILGVLAVAGFGAWYFRGLPGESGGAPEPILVGTGPVELAGLIYIAEDRGFFRENGLDARVKSYDSALSAIGGMKKGEVDISASTEYPLIAEVFGSGNIRVIACIDKYQTTYLVGMKDRGILNRSDVAGKKIGVSHGSIGEFYLGRFLELHGMSTGDVTLVNVRPPQVVAALIAGQVDAVVGLQSDMVEIQGRFGNETVVWPVQSGQQTFNLVAGRDEWIAGHPMPVRQFLLSLSQGVDYLAEHPREAGVILQRRLNESDSVIADILPEHHFSLSLDESLVTAMEDEARWMIANNLTAGRAIPDFRGSIYTPALQSIKPESVDIR